MKSWLIPITLWIIASFFAGRAWELRRQTKNLKEFHRKSMEIVEGYQRMYLELYDAVKKDRAL